MSAVSYGDVRLGDTVDFKFDTALNNVMTTLAGSPTLAAYPNNSTTEITAGITLSVDHDSRTGLHHVRIVATSGNGYTTATNYTVAITAGTVGGVSMVGRRVGMFSIEARSALMPATAARTLIVDAAGAITTVTTTTNLTNAATAGDLTATMKTSVTTAATAATPTAAAVTGAVGSVTGNVGGNVTGSVGSVATGGITAASLASDTITAAKIAADAITDAKVASDVTIASVTGAVGSVTGAVGSVTGNVGGNVTGSVGSVASGGITATSLAADAITAAKIADGAIDAATFASGALDAAWSTGTRTLTAGTNIVLAKGTGVTGLNDLSAAQVNAEADTAIADAALATAANLATVDDFLDTEIAAIKAKTDNLPAAPAAVGDIPSAATIASAAAAQVTTDHGSGSYVRNTEPLDAAGIRTAVGLGSANLDTQLGDVPTNSELAMALAAADDAVLAAIAALSIPTTGQNAAAVLAAAYEGAETVQQGLRLMRAALVGKASGLAGTTATFRSLADDKNRITATVTADGNRTAVTTDAT